MSEYENIKAECCAKGELWIDPSFPPTQKTVFYNQTPPFEFEWKRPQEICKNPKLIILNDEENFDILPGNLGDTWLMSCFGVLSLHKGLLHKVVVVDQSTDCNYAGIFRFRICWCGQWVEVLVDDLLPTVNGKLVFIQSSETKQMWPALLEKAYAKLHGSYEALKYGSYLHGLSDLFGGITELLPAQCTAVAIHNALQTTSIVTAQYSPKTHEHKINALITGMFYKICRIEKVESNTDGPVHVVLIQKPLASGEKPWSHLLLGSTSVPYYIRERLLSNSNGVWMLLDDFYEIFSRTNVVHLDGDTSDAESSLSGKHKWLMKKHVGSWMKGVSAGGCKNNYDTFCLNTQLQIVLSDPESLIISLNQHNILDPKVMGFSVYKLPRSLSETAAPIVFKNIRSAFNSQYANSRKRTERCKLEAATYLVIPSTYVPREEAGFTLRIFSRRPLQFKVLDHTPEMTKPALIKAPSNAEIYNFSQYEIMFNQIGDGHPTINTFQLEELLNMCLPNDYIKSCATIDTCRQIILTLDKTGTGHISLANFKDLIWSLMHWQQVFKVHAAEKMSVVRIEKLRDALKEVGFVVPQRILTLLVLRYMRRDGLLRFGDFVSAVMHLQRAFSIFQERYVAGINIMNVDLSEWLQCALMC